MRPIDRYDVVLMICSLIVMLVIVVAVLYKEL